MLLCDREGVVAAQARSPATEEEGGCRQAARSRSVSVLHRRRRDGVELSKGPSPAWWKLGVLGRQHWPSTVQRADPKAQELLRERGLAGGGWAALPLVLAREYVRTDMRTNAARLQYVFVHR